MWISSLVSLLVVKIAAQCDSEDKIQAPSDPRNVTWAAAYQQANDSLDQLTNAEKVNIVTGQGWGGGPCIGNTRAVPKINYPQLCLLDSPVGVRFLKGVTVFPAGIHTAATWDVELMRQRGEAMGEEARLKGVNVLLGPVCGPLGKIYEAGRGWEGFGPDPFLTGIAILETIVGMQSQGVQATAKHFIGNEQELNRTTVNSNIDDRTIHELYLWPFAEAVRAGVASIMCSYNKLNTTWACENDKVLNGLLKTGLEFKGYVMSDWDAQHSTVQSAISGLDSSYYPFTKVNMPGPGPNNGNISFGPALLAAVSDKKVPQSRLDDMVRRILAAFYYLGQEKAYPPVLFNIDNNKGGGPDVQANHKQIARAVARDGIILLKNDKGALPLKKPKSLAIIGFDAITNPNGANACVDRGCDDGTLAMGWGSGTADYPYLSSPFEAISARAQKEGTTITSSTTNDHSKAAAAAKSASTALVFINADSGEEYITVENQAADRVNLDPWHDGNGLVSAVAATGTPTIVVIHSVGALLLEKILAEKNVVAIVWAGLPGQESGNSLVDILYGDTSPSGKLPFTIAKARSDIDVAIAKGGVDDFKEGLYIDYRHFDKASITPRFEFGYGLSYTTFTITPPLLTTASPSCPSPPNTPPQTQASQFRLLPHIISTTLTNTGTIAGAEVLQLYLSLASPGIDFPPWQLRGFKKVFLKPGENKVVQFRLRRKDVSYWDVAGQQWKEVQGEIKFKVANSSRAEGQSGKLVLNG
ncbi:hypothetical protein FKW77_007013 [Venturia effusa]|uniref:beta-glucosidase n=1 Tax=Venturia effusa TaxID=50376 RepID=A0A517LHH8_9PEZI|nr:hypothetical protein FKW77_007013 [Venturia effusa]